jgi:hemerythrin
MQTFIEWRDDWLMHIARMDDEHKQLVDRINKLAECCQCLHQTPEEQGVKRPTFDEVMTMLDGFGEHIRQHFRHEEDYMLGTAYPDFDSHSYEHATLLAEYAEWLRDIRVEGMQCLDEASLNNLKGWIIGHIVGADKRFGRYYRETLLGYEQPHRDAFSRRYMRISLAE